MNAPLCLPVLGYEDWKDSYASLHLMMQVVGKVKLAQTPWVNHSWHVTLHPTARGLTTLLVPHEMRSFEIEFDFLDHQLRIETTDGGRRCLPLHAQPVADFYHQLLQALEQLGVPVRIHPMPNEIPDAIPLDQDRVHAAYDPSAVQRCWQAMVHAARMLERFRAGFHGKCSPVHFFWGGFDLAVTRFSGRRAPPHPGGVPNLPDWVAREAYSHEVSSCGFWPGGPALPEPVFYSYAYPEPEGYAAAPVPAPAYYHADLHEFILPWQALRQAQAPDQLVMQFLQSTYDAAASLGHWDRAELEFDPASARQSGG
ncbi:MAG: hypothetical protein JWP36_529 [Paucimonas sp.]|nr:hypothetical protein [Paucimonas sp.]